MVFLRLNIFIILCCSFFVMAVKADSLEVESLQSEATEVEMWNLTVQKVTHWHCFQ